MPHRQHSIRDRDSLDDTGVFLARNTSIRREPRTVFICDNLLEFRATESWAYYTNRYASVHNYSADRATIVPVKIRTPTWLFEPRWSPKEVNRNCRRRPQSRVRDTHQPFPTVIAAASAGTPQPAESPQIPLAWRPPPPEAATTAPGETSTTIAARAIPPCLVLCAQLICPPCSS